MGARATLLPWYLKGRNEREEMEYEQQLQVLRECYGEEAEFLMPVEFGCGAGGGDPVAQVDAILLPQLFGEIFCAGEVLEQVDIPIIVLTSEFGTVEMWDWEIVAWLRDELGKDVFFPYNQEMAKVILRALAARRSLKNSRFLMFQDNPGEGMQAYLFKRFYWWDEGCTARIEKAFGVQIVYRSWRELNVRAAEISDPEAEKLWEERRVPAEMVPDRCILKAVKLYLAVREAVEQVGNVCGVGSNCLNESFHSGTTPCLAWDWLFEYDHLIWACEGDTVSLISKYLMYSALKKPMMMTNIYPFLIGMAALKHEKITEFPDIPDPDNHALGVHCGYFGFAPQSFCGKWKMRPKVLEIVDRDAIVIDCEMETGPFTMAKLRPDMKKITVIEAEIEDYVQYPGSDCRNGALIRFRNRNGHKIMESFSSHHAILIRGDVTYLLLQMARVYGIETEVL